MYSFNRRGSHKGSALMAVLQAILLTSALVLAPAQVIAQDQEPQPSPASEQVNEPIAESTVPEPTPRPGPTQENSTQKPDPAPQTKPAVESAPAAPELTIRLFPKQLKLAPGGRKVITAWTCPADDRSPFGPDKKPGTGDDVCEPVRVKWSIRDAGVASLSFGRGLKTRVTLDAPRDTKIFAKADGLSRAAKIIYKEIPAKVRPNAVAPVAVSDPPAEDPTAEPSDAPAEDPTAEPSDAPAEDPTAEPSDAPAEDPTAEPSDAPAEDPTAEPSAAPAEDPTAEPSDAPAEDPTAEPSDAPAEDPTAEPIAPPAEDPTAEPSAAPAEDPTAEPCDIDPMTGECVADQGGDKPIAGDEPNADESDPAQTNLPDCDIDPFTGECAVEQPSADPTNDDPAEAPTTAPSKTSAFEVATTGTLRLRKAGYRSGSGTSPGLSPLAGANFKIYRADNDNNFEPGSGDALVGTFGPTDGNGIYDVQLDTQYDYWVQEESITTPGWGVIKQYALGGFDDRGTTTQYAFKYDIDSGTTSTRWFVNSRDNNGYPAICGMKVALIFDRSGSIDDGTEYVQLKNAAKSFVDALTGTPSEFAIVSFSNTAATNLGWTSVAGGGGTVKTAINNLPATSGGTNWDAAFRQVVTIGGAEVIVFMTDGNPTTLGGGGGSTGTVNPNDVEYGVASANLAKNQASKPKVVAIGVNNAGLNYRNLSLVSGPVENTDYYLTNFANLGATLRGIAEDVCGGSVTVIKEVPKDGGGWKVADGWTFDAASSGTSPVPSSGATGAVEPGTGAINFKYNNVGTVTATITESVKSGFGLVQQGGKNAVCTENGGTGINENNTANGVSFPLGPTDIVTCTFRNEPNQGSIELEKDWVGSAGDVTLNIGTSQGGSEVDSASANGADGSTGPNAVDTGTYYLSEVGDLSDHTIGDLSCSGAAASASKLDATNWSIEVAADETVVCTFTNTRDTASIELEKDWVGSAGDVTLNIGTSQGGSEVDSASANGADGSTGPNAVDTGTYYLSEVGDLSDHTIGDLSCSGAAASASKLDATNWSIEVAADETVVCTFTNTRDTASIELEKDWVGSAGDVTLNIGTSQGGSEVDSASANGADGSTGPNAVDTGTYYLSEVGDLSDHTIGDLSCSGAAASASKLDATNWSIEVAADETVVCTFTNTRDTASIELEKDWVGSAGDVTLNIGTSQGGSEVDSASANGADGSTGPNAVDTGTYYLSEVGDLSDHTIGDLSCSGAAASASKLDATNWSIEVAADETVVCTFTNTRDTASIELEKDWVGSAGDVTLNIGTSQGGSEVDSASANGADGSTGPNAVDTGTYYLSEVGDLSDHTIGDLSCSGAAASASKLDATNWSIEVAADETVVCTFTNTRDTASIELEKDWVGSAGDVTLNIGTSQGGSEVDSASANGADGSTGPNAVDTGTYYLSEVGDLSDHTIGDLSCSGAAASASKLDATNWSIEVAADETVVCTFTNTRDTASIELEKDWVGSAGDVTLNIGTSQGGSEVDSASANGADGSTGPNAVDTGTYYLSEVGDLSDHTIGDLSCSGAAASASKLDATNWSIEVAADETVVCTFTNTRDTASIELEKDWVGSAGDVTLNIGTSQGGSEVDSASANGADGSTGPNAVDTGTYYLSEVGDLSDHTIGDLSCSGAAASASKLDATNWSIEVAADETVVCTFTNTRDTASIELEKDWVGSAGDVTLNIGTSQGGSEVDSASANGADGSTGPNAVDTGTYYLSEVGDLSDHTIGDLSCSGAAASASKLDATNWSIEVAADETVVCTFTNTRDTASIELEKDWVGSAGDVTLNIGTSQGGSEVDSASANGADGSTGPNAVDTGTYYLSEVGDLSDHTIGDLSCSGAAASASKLDATNWSIEVAADETVVCTFTNTRDTASIELEKDWVGTAGDVTLNIGTSQGGSEVDSATANGADGSTGPNAVDTGTYYLSEVGDLSDHTIGDLSCSGAAASASKLDATNWSIEVAADETVVCTFTNYLQKLEIEKTSDVGFYNDVGDVIAYTIVASNTGQATLHDVEVTDEFPDGLDDWTCDPTTPTDLAPGETITCTATHTITEADIEAGSVYNEACTDSDETPEVCDDATVEYSNLEITKTSPVQFYDEVGDVITYTVVATNAGEFPLTGVEVEDKFPAGLDDWTCDPTTPTDLAPGETITCTASHTITEADIEAGSVYNQACADSDQTAEVCADVEVPLAASEITKTSSADYYSGPGEDIVYTVTFTNTGELTLTDVDITDELIDGLPDWTCTVGELEVTLPLEELLSGQQITCTATYTTTAVDVENGTVFNQACAESAELDSECADVTVPLAAFTIEKTSAVVAYDEVGDVIEYTITVTNTGETALTDVIVSDDMIDVTLDSFSCDPESPVAELAVGDTIECSGSYTITQADLDDGSVLNTACAITAEVDEQCDDHTVPGVKSPALSVEKVSTTEYYTAIGDVIDYQITVTNSGNVTLEDVVVTDAVIDIELDTFSCNPESPVATLAPNDTIDCIGTYTIVEADMEAGSILNTACAIAAGLDEACDEVTVPLAMLEIVKEADVDFYNEVGDEIVYTITATNVGQADLTNVDISDALIDGLASWECTPEIPADLAPTESITCSATYTIVEADIEAGSVPNTACAVSTEAPEVCAEVEVPLAKLEIVKTSDVSTYNAVGDLIVYTITATNVGQADLTNVDISDALIDGLADWECTPEIPADLAPTESITCSATYTIVEADIEAGAVVNTACTDSDQTPEVCDQNTALLVSLAVTKTANAEIVDIEGERVTFKFTVENTSPNPAVITSLEDDVFGTLTGDADCTVGTILAPGVTCKFKQTFFVEPDVVADPPIDTLPHENTFTACVALSTDEIPPVVGDEAVCAEVTEEVGFIGGSPTPPTDMLAPVQILSAASGDGPFGGTLSWITWLMLSASLILSAGWVVRRQRFAQI